MRVLKKAVVIMTLSCLAGCFSPGVVKARLDGDGTFDIRQGQTLELEMESNPTTGYSWDVAASENKGVLRQKRGSKYIPGSDLIGAGGVQIFYFEGLRRGRAELTFEYRRPWEKDKEPAGRHVILVNVH